MTSIRRAATWTCWRSLLPDARPGWEFFGWHEDLAPILGRKVDLHTPNQLESKYFRDEVLREAMTVYEQA